MSQDIIRSSLARSERRRRSLSQPSAYSLLQYTSQSDLIFILLSLLQSRRHAFTVRPSIKTSLTPSKQPKWLKQNGSSGSERVIACIASPSSRLVSMHGGWGLNREHYFHLDTKESIMTTGPDESQQRALAYAPKPFAALSFLSSLFVMYYLLIRRPDKRKRMYHRLILATFLCVLPLSFVMFWGTWAMPADTPWAIGASGTSVTCSIQGFLYIIFYLAFPFYYASFSVFAYVALKNNFQEEKYVWMEKWIHIGAYLLPLTLSIVALAKDWINPGLAICTLAVQDDCEIFYDIKCSDKDASTSIYAPIVSIILAELLGGTFVIIYLLCTFDSIQKEVDIAVGMKRMVEKARKHRLYEVAWQTGLYLVSFWFGYIPGIAESFVRLASGQLNYNLIICAKCVYAFQGFIILLVYFFLQQKSERDRVSAAASILPIPEGEVNTLHHTTVSNIRANVLRRRSSSQASKRSSMSRFSFHIFDGTPAEDSPWASFFHDGSEDSRLIATVVEEDESLFPDESIVEDLVAHPDPITP